MSPLRTSPVHTQLAALQPQWAERLGMQVASSVGADDAARVEAVALADLSYRRKIGLKGPMAEQWLRSHGVAPAEGVNAWAPLPAGGLVARLGRSEFFLEDAADGDTVDRVERELAIGGAGVYPVIRQDAGFALAGRLVNELLVQTCNINFAAIGAQDRPAVMTQMIGVSVLTIRTNRTPIPCYRLWCDPTFAPYVWETLCAIATELGGGAIGSDGVPGRAD